MVATSREDRPSVRDRLSVAGASFVLSGAAVVALVLALVVNFAFCYLSLALSVFAFVAIARAHLQLRQEQPALSAPVAPDEEMDVLDVVEAELEPPPKPSPRKRAARPHFPIADYDQLTAAEIVSVL